MKGFKNIFHANSDQQRVGIAILISDNIDFRTKMIIREREVLYNDKSVHPLRRYNTCKHIHLIMNPQNT